jgi:hypothetical protein
MVWGRRQLARGPTFPRRLRGVMPIGPMTWTEFALDSPLEEAGFELVWGFSCQVVVLVCWRFFVRRCVQVRLACSAGDSPAGVKVRAP